MNTKYNFDIEQMKWDYIINGYTYEQIAASYGCTRERIRQVLAGVGLHPRSGFLGTALHGKLDKFKTQYRILSDFFAEIDNELVAYWLGFIFADGYIGQQENHYLFGICLKDTEIEHLYQFRRDIDSNHPIRIMPDYHYAQIYVPDQDFISHLLKWGVTPRKSLTIQWPDNLPSPMVRHFIRGVMDGDGGMMKPGKQDRLPICEVAASGSPIFLESLQTELRKRGIISAYRPAYIKDGTLTNCAGIRVHRNSDKVTLFRLLYTGATRYLDRKLNWWRHCQGDAWVQQVLNADPIEIEQLGLCLF